jgi:hypothetical protein
MTGTPYNNQLEWDNVMNATQPTLPQNFITPQSVNLSTPTQGTSTKTHLNSSNESSDAFEKGVSEARMHLPATTLMGMGVCS